MKAVAQVFSLDLISKTLLGLSAILFIRAMPAEEYAAYTVALSVAVVGGQILTTGFNRTYIVGYQRLGLGRAPAAFLLLQIALALTLGLALFPLARAVPGLSALTLALILAMCLAEFARTSYQQRLRFVRFSSVELTRSLLLLTGAGLLVVATPSIRAEYVMAVHAGALVLTFTVVFAKNLNWSEFGQLRLACHWLRTIAAGPYRLLFVYTILIGVMTQSGIFLLRLIAGPEAVANYGSAFRYYTLLSLALGAVQAVFLPVIQKLESREELGSLFSKYRRFVLTVIPVVLGGAVASRWIIPIIDAGRYPEAVPVFQILSLSAVISLVFAPHVNVLLRLEDFRFMAVLAGVALAADVLANLFFVPRYGAPGTAISSLFAFAIVNGGVWWRSRLRLREFEDQSVLMPGTPGVPNLS